MASDPIDDMEARLDRIEYRLEVVEQTLGLEVKRPMSVAQLRMKLRQIQDRSVIPDQTGNPRFDGWHRPGEPGPGEPGDASDMT